MTIYFKIINSIYKMLTTNIFKFKQDLSKNNEIKISLIPENQNINKNDTNIILKVKLTISYALDSFEFSVLVPTRDNEKTKNKEFNMFDILKQIFSDFIKENNNNEYILSFSMDDSTDIIDNNIIKIYNYLCKLNSEFFNDIKDMYYKIPNNNIIYLKLRQKLKRENSLNPLSFEENENAYSYNLSRNINLEEEDDDEKNKKSGIDKEKNQKKKSGRDKEKTIKYAIIKVFKWEKIREKGGNNITLENAAKSINMAKKTLDDYKKQIKIGRDNNFNFNKYYKCKMNVLKDFNEKKLKEKKKNK